MTLELITGGLVMILALATTALSLAGAAGLLGLVRFPRCAECGRLGMVAAANADPTCVHCGHERLLHPLTTLHRARAAHHPRG